MVHRCTLRSRESLQDSPLCGSLPVLNGPAFKLLSSCCILAGAWLGRGCHLGSTFGSTSLCALSHLGHHQGCTGIRNTRIGRVHTCIILPLSLSLCISLSLPLPLTLTRHEPEGAKPAFAFVQSCSCCADQDLKVYQTLRWCCSCCCRCCCGKREAAVPPPVAQPDSVQERG